jgi:hypothetical protein
MNNIGIVWWLAWIGLFLGNVPVAAQSSAGKPVFVAGASLTEVSSPSNHPAALGTLAENVRGISTSLNDIELWSGKSKLQHDRMPIGIVSQGWVKTSNAQVDEDCSDFKRGTIELGVWQGGAFGATSLWSGLDNSQTKGFKFVLSGIRFGRVFASNRFFFLEHSVDLIPVAVAIGSFVECPSSTNDECRARTIDARKRGSVYGFGIVPLGFKMNLFPSKKIQPFLSAAGGLLRFQREVPIPGSTKFNFSSEFGGGVQLFNRTRHAITVGYKLYHVSNAGIGRLNPGLNMHIVFGGISIFKNRR